MNRLAPNRLEFSPRHRACRKLLPWYVNGTLNADERARVERHLEDCAVCREEVASLEDLQQCVRETSSETEAAVPGFGKVMAQIDAATAPRFRTPPAIRWALAAQAAAILVLAAMLIWPTAPASQDDFRTLSDPRVETGNAAPSFRIVFSETATEAELRRLLRSVEAEIVSCPSSFGVYTIRVRAQSLPPAERDDWLARVRREALVRLVEPIATR